MTSEREQLDRLKRRVERLTSVVIIQCVLLAAVVLMNVIQLAPYVALLLLIALPLLVFYRNQLPGAARWMGQTVGRWRWTSRAVPTSTEEQST